MQRIKITLFLFCTIAFSSANACAPEDQKQALQYAEQALSDLLQNTRISNEVLELMDQAVSICPDEARFILERANIHMIAGNYEQAKQDYQLADSYTPLPAEILFTKCVLQEYSKEPRAEWLACYQQVEQKYSPQKKEQLDVNYVLAALFAESPDADNMKQQS